jgi:1-acyl-sn-glycerol-3-phosphate acyltransferase
MAKDKLKVHGGFAYKMLSPFMRLGFRIHYNPKIVNKEAIPKKGPIIIACNHKHVFDQCFTIMATKRVIHYMAKREYFDGKFAWFFRIAGCIPVDRSIHDDKATNAALEILNKGGAIGIFPEGTRNALKDVKIEELYDNYFKDKMTLKEFSKKIKKNKLSFINYLEELKDKEIISKEEFINNIFDIDNYLKNKEDYIDNYLLPLKYGAVSMAYKTKALIVPYAITGNYKFRSKDLTINIGKAFAVDDNLEKANKKLDKEIKKLIKENLKNND